MIESYSQVYHDVLLGNLDTSIGNYQQFIHREVLPPYVKTMYQPDQESQRILQIGDFEVAYLYRVLKNDMNIVVVMGQQGRGKTNLIQYPIKFCKALNVPFSWEHNLYIGEDTIMHRKYLKKRHPNKGEHVISDEAEFLNVPNSKQLRELKYTLASCRDSGLHFWFLFPTPKDFNMAVVDSHANWIIQVSYRDDKRRIVRFKIFFKVTFENQFHGAEWVEYPFPNRNFIVPFLPKRQFNKYIDIKERIYDISHTEDYWKARNKFEAEMKILDKDEDKEKLLLEVSKIMKSKLSKQSKAIAVSQLQVGKHKYPNYMIAKRLGVSNTTLIKWLEDFVLESTDKKAVKKPKGET